MAQPAFKLLRSLMHELEQVAPLDYSSLSWEGNFALWHHKMAASLTAQVLQTPLPPSGTTHICLQHFYNVVAEQ